MKKVFLLLLVMLLSLSAMAEEGKDAMMVYIHVNDAVLPVTLAENSSSEALLALLAEEDLTIQMHDYAGFEKVGALPTSLPRNDEQITTQPGDVILYQGNQITLYYDTNSWNFTLLGHVEGFSQAELMSILGDDDITALFTLHEGNEMMTSEKDI